MNHLFARLWTTLLLASFAIQCRTSATQVELFIDSDAPANRQVRVRIRSFSGVISPTELPARAMAAGDQGEVLLDTAAPGGATLTLGGSVGVLPWRMGETAPVTVWLRAQVSASATAPEVLLDRVVRFSFFRGQRGTIRVFLPLRCGDTAVGCTSVSASECTVSVRCREQNATCGDQGECVVPEVIPVVAQDAGAENLDSNVPLADVSSGRYDSSDIISSLNDSGADAASLDALDPRDDVGDADSVVADAAEPVLMGPPLLFPQSVSRISCRNPPFRWFSVAGADGYQIQICASRSCSFGVSDFASAFPSLQPPGLLSASRVVFWRVRAMQSGLPLTRWSAVWEFQTSAVVGARCTFTGLIADFNGDGYGDITVAAPGAVPPAVQLFYGRMGGPTVVPNLTIQRAVSSFAARVAFAGDVNGDGFGDLLISAPQEDRLPMDRTGAVYVHLGSATGVNPSAASVLFDSTPNREFGGAVAGVGDTNADGYGDFVVGTPRASGIAPNAGGILYFRGGSSFPLRMPVGVFASRANAQSGVALDAAGDVDSDSFADVIAGAAQIAQAGVYRGSLDGLRPGILTFAGPPPTDVNRVVAGAGDIDGDAYADVAVGSPDGAAGGSVGVYFGGPEGSTFATQLTTTSSAGSRFGASISAVGDIDGDGLDEIIVGAPGIQAAEVWQGNMVRLRRVARLLLSPEVGFGTMVRGVIDCNGDAIPDVLVGNPSAMNVGGIPVGSVSVYYPDGVMGVPLDYSLLLSGSVRDSRFGAFLAQFRRFSRVRAL